MYCVVSIMVVLPPLSAGMMVMFLLFFSVAMAFLSHFGRLLWVCLCPLLWRKLSRWCFACLTYWSMYIFLPLGGVHVMVPFLGMRVWCACVFSLVVVVVVFLLAKYSFNFILRRYPSISWHRSMGFSWLVGQYERPFCSRVVSCSVRVWLDRFMMVLSLILCVLLGSCFPVCLRISGMCFKVGSSSISLLSFLFFLWRIFVKCLWYVAVRAWDMLSAVSLGRVLCSVLLSLLYLFCSVFCLAYALFRARFLRVVPILLYIVWAFFW